MLKSIINKLINSFIKIVNYLTIKKENYIYFIPHYNCKVDKYDIINYTADNVLSLFNYIVSNNILNNYIIIIEIHNYKDKDKYLSYIKSINNRIKVIILPYGLGNRFFSKTLKIKYINNYKYFFRSKTCFISTHYNSIKFKTLNQKIICLGYYTPFKRDYHIDSKTNFNKWIDHYITTSDISSRIISTDTNIKFNKFKAFGFPRNDYMIKNTKNKDINKYLKKKKISNYNKYIIYTPTYRDYEKNEKYSRKNILGYSNNEIKHISKLLTINNAVLMIKLHPLQNKIIIKQDYPDNFTFIEEDENISLYDILPITCALITDYTSLYFDYLLLNRPIIFNFYDINIYKKARGFSYDPIESICAGQIAYNFKELYSSINNVLIQVDNFSKDRFILSNIMNKYNTISSSKRIIDYFFNSNKKIL